MGLLDTATDITILTPNLVAQLGLVYLGEKDTETSIGSAKVKLYQGSLSIPNPGSSSGPLLTRSPLLVMESLMAFTSFDVVVGLDILTECLLIFDGPGKQFTLAV
jgi:hypothetical protein